MVDNWFPGDSRSLQSVIDEMPHDIKQKKADKIDEKEKVVKPWGTYKRKAYVGLDLGKKADPTAIVVLEPYIPIEERSDGRDVYDVSFIARAGLETPYPDIARKLADIDAQLMSTGEIDYVYYTIDSGGVGESVTDMIIELLPNADNIMRVYLTGGIHPNINYETNSISLPKAQMVSAMIMLFESGRIKISTGEFNSDIEELRDELYNFELKIQSGRTDTYGAFKFGKHDDLACALGMSCWLAEYDAGLGTISVW